MVGPARTWPAGGARLPDVRTLRFVSPGDRSRIEGPGHAVVAVNDVDRPREGLVAPDAAVMRRVLAFAEASEGRLYVGCFAGISRSPAAAYAIACRHGGPGREAELAATLRRASPSATPNRLMVALADEVLGRGGRMIAAIAAIGRGADACEGESFVWNLSTGEAQRLQEAPSSTAASATCSTAPKTSPV